jgi:hypothetical protein
MSKSSKLSIITISFLLVLGLGWNVSNALISRAQNAKITLQVPKECKKSKKLADAFDKGIKNYLQTRIARPQDTDAYQKYSGDARYCFTQGHLAGVVFSTSIDYDGGYNLKR